MEAELLPKLLPAVEMEFLAAAVEEELRCELPPVAVKYLPILLLVVEAEFLPALEAKDYSQQLLLVVAKFLQEPLSAVAVERFPQRELGQVERLQQVLARETVAGCLAALARRLNSRRRVPPG